MEYIEDNGELPSEHDPRSWNYRRIMVRPDLHMAGVLVRVCTVLVSAMLAFGILFWLLEFSLYASLWLSGLLCLAIMAFCGKRIAIWFVHVYQRFAPFRIRMKCRFEPSCTEYMIQSLEKYGLVRGAAKGIGRLCRCRPGHGGFDYP